MLSKKFIAAILAIMVVAFTGCSAQGMNSSSPESDNSITFTDDLGQTITVDDPQRVATLLGSFAEIWYLAGGEVIAAPDDAWDDFDLPMSEDAVNLGNTKSLSLELLFSADPDFIIASTNTKIDLDWKETINNAGITIAYFDVADFDDYLRVLKICTDITGREDLYQENGVEVKEKIDEIIQSSQERIEEKGVPKVLAVRASASRIRAVDSSNNVLGEMLKSLGCENIADSETSLLENLSMEYIMTEDPDFIFIVQSGDDYEGTQQTIQRFIEENPAWQSLTAVQNDCLFFMDKRLYNLKPNALWDQAYEQLEQILSSNKY